MNFVFFRVNCVIFCHRISAYLKKREKNPLKAKMKIITPENFQYLASWIAIGLCSMGTSAVVVAVLFSGVEV